MDELARTYRLMALNNAWANATLYAAMAEMDAAAFAAPRPGFFPSLKATMNHIWLLDLYYLDALEEGGLGRGLRDRPEEGQVAELARRQAHADVRLVRFCGRLDARTLAAPRVTMRVAGDEEHPVTETVEALLLHLIQHQIHHRGQAHVQLQAAGIAPPQLDEFYLTYDRAPTAEAYFS